MFIARGTHAHPGEHLRASSLLDFPVLERFIEEIKNNHYDIVAISGSRRTMQGGVDVPADPRASAQGADHRGRHIAAFRLKERVDADMWCGAKGIRWFREFLGDDVNSDPPSRDQLGHGTRTMGMKLSEKPGTRGGVDPFLGCRWDAISARPPDVRRQGEIHQFLRDRRRVVRGMKGLERDMQVQAFFVMDENFMLHRKRALRLLRLMKENHKSWSCIFSVPPRCSPPIRSGNCRTGHLMVWMGLEGKQRGM